jgi:carboxyl-terminal processing protease
MSLKTRAILVLVVGTVMGLSLSIGGDLLASKRQPSGVDLELEQAHLFAEVMKRIKSDYVEPIDDSELLESAIRGMVSDLDPHSQYLDVDEYRDIRISTTGSYTGIGIEVTEVDGDIRVITPIAGSPAARSGIRSGDEIIAVDGIMVDADRLQDTIGQMRGRRGSRITITVLREDETIDHEMRREVIRVASVHY